MRAKPGETTNLPPRAGTGPSEPVTTDQGSTVTALNAQPVSAAPRIDDVALKARDGMVRGSAVDENTEPEEKAEVLRFLVLKDNLFSHNGHRVKLQRGKVIDSLNYDIRKVKLAGTRLRKLEEGEDGTEFLEEGGFAEP